VDLEFLGCLLDRRSLVWRLDGAKPCLLGGNLTDGPGNRLRRFGLACHAASIGRKISVFNSRRAFTAPGRTPVAVRECPLVAHRDGRRFDGPPSLSGHCGHGPIFIGQRSVANDPIRTFVLSSSCTGRSDNFSSSQAHSITVGADKFGQIAPSRPVARRSMVRATWRSFPLSPALRSPSIRCSRSLGSLKGAVRFQLSIVKAGLIRSTAAASAPASSSCLNRAYPAASQA